MNTDRIGTSRVAVGAACAIFDGRGHVLLVRHTYGRLNWELPGGGSVSGESPDETAQRELREETGLELAVDRLTGVYYEDDHESEPMLHFVFRCPWVPGLVPEASSPEIAEVGFSPIDDLPTPISDFTERRVSDAWSGRPAAAVRIDRRAWRA